MRAVHGKLLLAENGSGKIDVITVTGDKASVTVIKEGLRTPTAVEPAGDLIGRPYVDRRTWRRQSSVDSDAEIIQVRSILAVLPLDIVAEESLISCASGEMISKCKRKPGNDAEYECPRSWPAGRKTARFNE
jgi:hypothetical protein